MTPRDVTNRPARARLLAEGGTIRSASRRHRRQRASDRSTWLMLGVLLGILFCLALSLWREAGRASSERYGQPPTANPTGFARPAFDLRLAALPVAEAEITTYGLAYRRAPCRTASGAVYDYRKPLNPQSGYNTRVIATWERVP